MLSRVVTYSTRAGVPVSVRRFSVFDFFGKKQEEVKTTTVKSDEDIINDLNQAKEILNGGGGIKGKMMNMAMKPMLDKMGGKDAVEKMMSDPRFLEHAKQMMKDPVAMAKAQEAMKEMMKNGTLPKQ